MNIHAYLHFAVSLSKTPELIHGLNYGCRITPTERWNCFDVNYTKNYTNNHTLSILSLKQLRLFVAKLIPSCIFIPRISVWNINMCVRSLRSKFVIYILSFRDKQNSLNLLTVGVENVYCRVSFQEEQSTSAFKKLLIQEKWSLFTRFAGVRGVAP